VPPVLHDICTDVWVVYGRIQLCVVSTYTVMSGGQIGISNSPLHPADDNGCTRLAHWVWAVWNGIDINLPRHDKRINFREQSPSQADQSLVLLAHGTRVTTTSKLRVLGSPSHYIKSAAFAPDTTPPVISS